MHFKFGENWKNYLKNLNQIQIDDAIDSLKELLKIDALEGRSFLDIGSGSGIFSLSAYLLGANVYSFDYDIDSVGCTNSLRNRYFTSNKNGWTVSQGDILDKEYINKLGQFDIVYSWGSLHHTGKMREAITNACRLINNEGILVLSIYNKHFTSPIWKIIKFIYNISPLLIKKMMYHLFIPVIFIAKYLATRENPLKKERGMNFFIDTIDWLGGYPYEYASANEVIKYLSNLGFKIIREKTGDTPIACNEFVFEKIK